MRGALTPGGIPRVDPPGRRQQLLEPRFDTGRNRLVFNHEQELTFPVPGGDVEIRAPDGAYLPVCAHRLGMHVRSNVAYRRVPLWLMRHDVLVALGAGGGERIHPRMHE